MMKERGAIIVDPADISTGGGSTTVSSRCCSTSSRPTSTPTSRPPIGDSRRTLDDLIAFNREHADERCRTSARRSSSWRRRRAAHQPGVQKALAKMRNSPARRGSTRRSRSTGSTRSSRRRRPRRADRPRERRSVWWEQHLARAVAVSGDHRADGLRVGVPLGITLMGRRGAKPRCSTCLRVRAGDEGEEGADFREECGCRVSATRVIPSERSESRDLHVDSAASLRRSFTRRTRTVQRHGGTRRTASRVELLDAASPLRIRLHDPTC